MLKFVLELGRYIRSYGDVSMKDTAAVRLCAFSHWLSHHLDSRPCTVPAARTCA